MTQIRIAEEVANQIRSGEGPIELVDEQGQTIGVVRRPPTEAEIERARQRASRGGQRLSWAQVMAMVRREVGEGPMTGYDSLQQQRQRFQPFLSYCFLMLMPGWLAMLAFDSVWLSRSVIVLTFLWVGALVVESLPACPHCRKFLAQVWWGGPIHPFCPHCGADFASELTPRQHRPHQRALTPDP